MCDYLSFCGDLNGEQFWFEPMLSSHSATAERNSLKPDTYREFEWTADDETSLSVRVHSDDPHNEAWMRACVLAKWPTRKALEDWLIVNVPQSLIYKRFAQGGHRSTLTGGNGSTLTGGHRSTLTGGNGSTLAGGDGSTLIGGHRSTLTGGNGSTLTGGDDSTLTGGHRSTLTGGNGSTLTGGHRSTLTGGNGSTLTGGDDSTLTGGYGSILAFWDYRDGKYHRHVAIVGKDEIKPNVPYRIVDGKVAEVPQSKEASR